MTKASDLLVAALENEGVEYIFGVPGEENLDACLPWRMDLPGSFRSVVIGCPKPAWWGRTTTAQIVWGKSLPCTDRVG